MDNTQNRRLISLYKEQKCLWDPNDDNFKNRSVRDDVWRHISRKMDDVPVAELKKKMRSLSGGYRREKFREKQSRINGPGLGDGYKSRWFAFEDFAYMDTKDPGTTQDTDHVTHQHQVAIKEEPSSFMVTVKEEPNLSMVAAEEANSSMVAVNKNTGGKPTLGASSSATIFRKRQHNPNEFHMVRHQMNQVLTILKKHNDEEDECNIFGRLVANKIRKLPENRRDLMMMKINQLFYDEHNSMPNSAPSIDLALR